MSVSFQSGISISSGIKLTAPPAIITINTQPSNASPFEGQTATYSVNASISRGAQISYQWQKQESTGGGWSNVTNATANTYTTPSLVYTNDFGDLYRCVINGTLQAATVTSNTANTTMQRSVITPGYVTTTSDPIYDGDSIVLFVSGASVSNGFSLSYQWQRQDVSGGSWTDISGATSQNYSITVSEATDNGDKFRCYLTATGAAIPQYATEYTMTVTVASGRLTIANGSANGTGYYGGNDGTSYDISDLTFNPFGSVPSNVTYAVYQIPNGDDSRTLIKFKPGTYDGYTVAANGAIDNDRPAHWRWITIGSGSTVLTYADPYYMAYGDVGQIYNNLGGWIPLQYVPADNTTPYDENTLYPVRYGSFYRSARYGASGASWDKVFGQIRSQYLLEAYYDSGDSKTYITLYDGTYTSNGTSFTVTNGAIGSDTSGSSRKFTIGTTTEALTFGAGGRYSATGDKFLLVQNIDGNVGPVSAVYDPGKQSSGGAGGGSGGGSGAYTAGTDYGNGNGGPPGAVFFPAGGPNPNPVMMIIGSGWTNTTGFNAVKALSSGATFTVSTEPAGGGSPITSTLTLLSGWTNTYSDQWQAQISSSPTINYQFVTPVSISVGGGASGPITIDFGFWGGPNGNEVIFVINGSTHPESVTAMDALTANKTVTLTDSQSGTVSVTISGTLTKSGPFGPGFYQYNGTTTTYNQQSSSFQNLTTVTP